jgi:hypothetical protein
MAMKLMGCNFQWLGFASVSVATILGVLLWSAVALSGIGSQTTVGSGANLLTMVFGAVSYVCGVDVTKGWRSLLLHIFGCATLLLVYYVAVGLFMWGITLCPE